MRLWAGLQVVCRYSITFRCALRPLGARRETLGTTRQTRVPLDRADRRLRLLRCRRTGSRTGGKRWIAYAGNAWPGVSAGAAAGALLEAW